MKAAILYLGTRLAPLVPQVFVGRSARQEPPCSMQECGYRWFKESAIVKRGILIYIFLPGSGDLGQFFRAVLYGVGAF